MIQFDHMAIDARDAASSARFMAGILGVGAPVPEGADDDMFRVDLDHGGFVLFSPSDEPRFTHLAFRVDAKRFTEIVGRLKEQKIAFGNDHGDITNGQTADPLGGAGRVYFRDANGHLFEVAY
jgi:catechol 2,3-dioxygenase-like lactoylglutathione lyase family enzyme